MAIIFEIHVENKILKIYSIRFLRFKGRGKEGRGERGKKRKGTEGNGTEKEGDRGEGKREDRRQRRGKTLILTICCRVLHNYYYRASFESVHFMFNVNELR